MEQISTQKLAEILNCNQKVFNTTIDQISTDSRQISSSSAFIAIKGEKFDGHDFAAEVIKNGCPIVIVEHQIDGVPAENQLIVDDTLKAYGKIGAYNRSLYKGTVIGLTGSAGKTTTKEEIAFLLSKFAPVYATKGNHNNFIGVPQSLCELDMNSTYAVIEMGMSAKGEIAYLTDLVKPDIAIITNVYPMHIEFFDNFEGIAHAKAEIFQGLTQNGTAIINEDTNFADILEREALKYCHHIMKFGQKTHTNFKFETAQQGEQYVYNAWCALTVVEALGLDVEKAAAYVKDFGALEGRGKHHQLLLSNGDTYTLIDDSYSGQPEAMILAIKALDQMPVKNSGRKIVVLGKMAELGETSKARHIEVGQTLAHTNIDIVVGVCEEMKDMLAQLPASKTQYYFENKTGLADFLLNNLLQKDDIVLIKGARYSSQLYQVTAELLKSGRDK